MGIEINNIPESSPTSTIDLNSLTAKTTPVDADLTLIGDSASSFANKKTTFANFKATLKTYFDTLYQTVSAALLKANNLSDLTNVATAKTNLSLVKADVGLSNVDNTSDVNKPVSTATQTALNLKQDTSGKDATGGYAGLTLFKINFKNALNTFTSFFTNANTAARTYTFQDRDGTIIDDTNLVTGSTDNAVIRADGTGGKTTQSTNVIIDDNNVVTVNSTGSNPHLTVSRNGTGGTGLKIANTTTNGYTTFWLSTGSLSAVCYGFGSTYTTSGRFIQGGLLFDNDGTGGITFNCQNSNSNAVVRFMTNSSNERMRIDKDGNVGIGQTTVTARLHLPAGATGASTAPLKLTTGSLNTTAEAGAVEFLTDQIYFTQTQNAIRKQIALREATRVTTQFDKTNTTLADITGLTATLGAGKAYIFKAVLFVDPDVVGGQKYSIGGTATATSIIFQINSYDNATNVNTLNSRQTALGGSIGQVGTTSAYTEITGTIVCNATGTLTIQFAQNSASGTSSVLVGSSFVVENIL